jgi:hypothetical protein
MVNNLPPVTSGCGWFPEETLPWRKSGKLVDILRLGFSKDAVLGRGLCLKGMRVSRRFWEL